MSTSIRGFNIDGVKRIANIFKQLASENKLLVKKNNGESCFFAGRGEMALEDIFSFLNYKEIRKEALSKPKNLSFLESQLILWDADFKRRSVDYFGEEVSISCQL